MRQIEREMLSAFNNEYNYSKSNTSVDVLSSSILVRLHGNIIAIKNRETGEVRFTLSGWNTVTTRSRLNALGCAVRCKNFEPIRDGKNWWSDFSDNEKWDLMNGLNW